MFKKAFFTRCFTTVNLTFDHSNSDRFILESKWPFVPNLEEIPPGVRFQSYLKNRLDSLSRLAWFRQIGIIALWHEVTWRLDVWLYRLTHAGRAITRSPSIASSSQTKLVLTATLGESTSPWQAADITTGVYETLSEPSTHSFCLKGFGEDLTIQIEHFPRVKHHWWISSLVKCGVIFKAGVHSPYVHI